MGYEALDTCVGRELADLWYEHRSLNPARARKVLESTAYLVEGRWFAGPALRIALKSLSPEDALDLFEGVGAKEVAGRHSVVEQLSLPGTALLGLQELPDAIDGMILHLHGHREELLQWGRASESCSCLFLEELLGALYPTEPLFPLKRVRCDLDQIDVSTDEGEPAEFPEDLSAASGLVGQREIDEVLGKPRESLPFVEPRPSFNGLRVDELSAVADLRHQVLDAKLALLGWVSDVLRSEDARARFDREECWRKVITGSLSPDEISFLLRIDAHLTGYDITSGTSATGVGENPGGLSAMLLLLEHVCREVAVGPLSGAALELTNLAAVSPRKQVEQTLNYFDLVARSSRASVDALIQDYRARTEDAARVGARWLMECRKWLREASLGEGVVHRHRVGTKRFYASAMKMTLRDRVVTVTWPGGKVALHLSGALEKELARLMSGTAYRPASAKHAKRVVRLRDRLMRSAPLINDPIPVDDGAYTLEIPCRLAQQI